MRVVAFQGRRGNGGRLKKNVTINMLLSGVRGKAQGGGSMVSATVDVVGQRQGGGCSDR